MKIAVLTLSLHANYGGNLQAYALLTALRDMGHDAWYLNRERHKVPMWKVPFVVGSRALRKYVLRQKVNVMAGIYNQRKRAVVARHSREFIGKYITPQTPEFLTSSHLKRDFPRLGFDAVIVGSDQVWRQRFVKGNLSDYYFGFVDENDSVTRRISYAASFGTSEWEYSADEVRLCKPLLARFDAVSVRESSGVELCKEHFGVDAEHVVDPTMLLDASRYEGLIPEPARKLDGILVYVLDGDAEKRRLVDLVSERLGLPTFSVNGDKEENSTSESVRPAPPVEEWIRGFRDAKFVVTDSFHGTVFAIIFNKPFIAYGNRTRGMARFSSLLKMFGLEDRLVTSVDALTDRMLVDPDWAAVNDKLKLEKARAHEFLSRALAQG